jgi:hypothetical protein
VRICPQIEYESKKEAEAAFADYETTAAGFWCPAADN